MLCVHCTVNVRWPRMLPGVIDLPPTRSRSQHTRPQMPHSLCRCPPHTHRRSDCLQSHTTTKYKVQRELVSSHYYQDTLGSTAMHNVRDLVVFSRSCQIQTCLVSVQKGEKRSIFKKKGACNLHCISCPGSDCNSPIQQPLSRSPPPWLPALYLTSMILCVSLAQARSLCAYLAAQHKRYPEEQVSVFSAGPSAGQLRPLLFFGQPEMNLNTGGQVCLSRATHPNLISEGALSVYGQLLLFGEESLPLSAKSRLKDLRRYMCQKM